MLQVRLLGQFDVLMDGKRILFPARAAQSLFAYLILTAGTLHRREKLAGLVWPDTSEETARRNLRQHLWLIRKALAMPEAASANYLRVDDISIGFEPQSEYWLDVAELERPVAADDGLTDLSNKLQLYRGELLAGFYDEWVLLERERVQALFESKMQILMEQLIAAERWTAVLEWGEKWLSFGHVPEPAFRALMLAYAARGDLSRVTAIYQRGVNALRDELGVEPSIETRALYDGLIKGAQSPSRVPPAQASGTVTFLFTDIEGSTRLLERLREHYATVLHEHHDLLRAAIRRWNGSEIDTQGDAFFCTFTRATDAIACAVEAQRTLQAHAWEQDERVRVRMGLHTGEPLMATTGYIGMDVHRAARIGDAGHGGQVLLSQTTRDLAMHELPEGVTLRNLGEHRLKDLKYPTEIYQLVIQGLQNDFPPLKSHFTGNEPPAPGEAPFKGLEYFDVADADLFFGREALTEKLIGRLREMSGMLVVVGASGSGKSSLVRAGMIPGLENGTRDGSGSSSSNGKGHPRVQIITPTAHPLEALATELTRESESVTATATLMDDLAQDPRSLHLYLVRQAKKTKSKAPHTLLVIDQFEELFTLCRDEFERQVFIDNLLTALASDSSSGGGQEERRLVIVLTLRADFYAHLAQYPQLRDAVAHHQEYIGPMTSEELRRAIEEPAKQRAAESVQWEFEPGLVDLILRDVGDEPGALPLLSHALLETWKRRAGHTLTLKGYADAGGVRGAIAHTAETVFQTLSSEQQLTARSIFLRLAELGEGTEDTRRRASFDELMLHSDEAEQVREVLNTLADARLITLSQNTADVAHEALIREWGRLREWLNEDREGLRLHRKLTEAAQEWELLERDPSALYRGARLAQAWEWVSSNAQTGSGFIRINEAERAFLLASLEQEQKEQKEREEQRRRELDSAKQIAEAATHIAEAAQKLAVEQAARAEETNRLNQHLQRQERIATARELAVSAVGNLSADPERSILLALEAVKATECDGTVLLEAEEALHQSIYASHLLRTLKGHPYSVTRVSYTPDGTQLVTHGNDGTIRIWEVESGKDIVSLTTHPAYWENFCIAQDGIRLGFLDLTDDNISVAKIWDIPTGQLLRTTPLRIPNEKLNFSSYNSDLTRLATGDTDGTTTVCDADTGKPLLKLIGHTAAVNDVAYSPDGTRIATGSEDKTAKIWDAATGRELMTFRSHTFPIVDVTYTLDGTRLGTASTDGTARVWDIATGELLLVLGGHKNAVNGIAFSQDGAQIATGSSDSTAKVWDAANGKEVLSLAGHTDECNAVAFDPDGTRLATASHDGTAKIWDIAPSREALAIEITGGISSSLSHLGAVVYSPDGERLAAGLRDGTIKIWDAQSGQEQLTLRGHADAVNKIAFSFDGTQLASASDDKTARIWDIATGKELWTFTEQAKQVNSVSFSPDGTYLATAVCHHGVVGYTNGYVKIYNAQTGTVFTILPTTHLDVLTSVAFSPDGTRIAAGGFWGLKGEFQVWALQTGKTLLTQSVPTRVSHITYSPEGSRLATIVQAGYAQVWDAATSEELLSLPRLPNGKWITYSPDGTRIAALSLDGTIRLWNAASGKELLTLYGDKSGLQSAAFSPDGTRLAVASNEAVRVYLLQIEDLIALAKSRLTRSLTREEYQKYLHIEEYSQ